MNKWTVVIPTIWKSDFIHEQIKEYVLSEYIDEVIIIDNSREYFTHHKKVYNKVKLIQPDTNLFVNPSWNLGVRTSKNDKVIIANDDILWNTHILERITDEHLSEFGVIGQDTQNFGKKGLDEIKEIDIDILEVIDDGGKIPPAWGCLLLTTKQNWKHIPETMKIWYGDVWISKKSGIKTGRIKNISIGGEINGSETSEYSKIRQEDGTQYRKLK